MPSTQSLRRVNGPLLGGLIFSLFLLLLLARWGIGVYVDFLWFASEGASDIFLTRLIWESGGRLGAGAIVGVLAWVNLRLVARTLGAVQIRRRVGDLVIQEKLPERYVRWGVWAASILIGLLCAALVPAGVGLRGLLLLNAPEWGRVDPILGRDVSFYIFVLPVFGGLVTFGIVTTVFLGGLVGAGYSATGAIQWVDGRVRARPFARTHLGILGASFLVLLAIRFHLAPFGLVQDGNSGVQGIFGYADHRARIPAYRVLTVLALLGAAGVAWGVVKNRLLVAGGFAAALGIGAFAALQIFPAIVQRFQVEPNELARESAYIEQAVEYTRDGFGLGGLVRERLDYAPPSNEDWLRARDRFRRLPVWTESTLLATFRQIEARFEYYDFHRVAFDRYPGEGGEQPVAVAVREVDPDGIPDPSWQNLHLRERYISGMGAAAGQLNDRTADGRLPMFLTGIPPAYRAGPDAPVALDLRRASVYVGSRPQLHAVINPDRSSFLAPDGTPGRPGEDYPSGIRMGSPFRTAALAWRFQDANLLLASEVGPESRLLFRREVRERVGVLAPFLFLPEDPYPVVADGRIIWILEAFTVSRSFPLSTEHPIDERRSARYLRNSVKATVDAVTGETRLYVADPDDALLRAYRGAFPTLFRDLDEMPEALRRHLRYSRHLFDVQSRVLLQYHQDSPPVFHGQQERWAVATELSMGTAAVPYRPEYAMLTLPGEEEESWVLSTVFVPQGRQNLASFLAGRWRAEGGGELRLWDVPVESQLRGPRQIEALVEQDPEISQQFSLWRQGGSEVWTGHLHLVPVGSTIFYMEPVFLAADHDAIPEIRRYIVSDGNRVIMDPTIEGAVAGLAVGMEGVVAGADVPLPMLPGDGPLPGLPPGPGGRAWFDDALRLLDEADERLQEGDWSGFGGKLDELRDLLRRQGGSR